MKNEFRKYCVDLVSEATLLLWISKRLVIVTRDGVATWRMNYWFRIRWQRSILAFVVRVGHFPTRNRTTLGRSASTLRSAARLRSSQAPGTLSNWHFSSRWTHSGSSSRSVLWFNQITSKLWGRTWVWRQTTKQFKLVRCKHLLQRTQFIRMVSERGGLYLYN